MKQLRWQIYFSMPRTVTDIIISNKLIPVNLLWPSDMFFSILFQKLHRWQSAERLLCSFIVIIFNERSNLSHNIINGNLTAFELWFPELVVRAFSLYYSVFTYHGCMKDRSFWIYLSCGKIQCFCTAPRQDVRKFPTLRLLRRTSPQSGSGT